VIGEDYEIAWTPSARRALIRLPEKVAPAAIEFIYGALASRPAVAGRPLRFELDGLHGARRGDYRVQYHIVEDEHRVNIVTIEHRADVYRRRT
jgi:mRNA interferase RelE/StbE